VRRLEVTAVEGLAGVDGTLSPVQQALRDHDGFQCGYWFQCGYCTPGQLVSATACVAEGATPVMRPPCASR
jgi:xanthine dehydrogenase YagT iron-sulfur-binding subunit